MILTWIFWLLLPLNFSFLATFQTCKDTFGRIDILINSAGSHGELPLQEVGLRILDINLVSEDFVLVLS